MNVCFKTSLFQRIFFIIIFLVIIYIEFYLLLIYEFLFYLSFEYLNSNSTYLKLKYYKVYNNLFLFFLVFIVLVRCNLFNFSETVHYHLNSLEHLFFALIICLLLSIYIQIFKFPLHTTFQILIFVFITFNGIGFLNEFFQNFFQQTPIFILNTTDIKDLIINFIGSTFFILISMFYKIKN